ncbi:hypothetical protein A0H81_11421 [Grifola frondosa]|nr:hypothetical protein A0H81_11421 [Grifola frondosa]
MVLIMTTTALCWDPTGPYVDVKLMPRPKGPPSDLPEGLRKIAVLNQWWTWDENSTDGVPAWWINPGALYREPVMMERQEWDGFITQLTALEEQLMSLQQSEAEEATGHETMLVVMKDLYEKIK